MQLSLALLLLLPLTLAHPTKRTAATIETDIKTVATDLTAFDKSINSFTGSLLQALSLLSAYESLAGAVTTATAAVTSTGALGSADSATIYTAVASLTAQVVTTLGDAVAKYSVVESAGYASEVCSALASLSTDTDAFYKALETELYTTYTTEVSTLQATADADFVTTIAKYGC